MTTTQSPLGTALTRPCSHPVPSGAMAFGRRARALNMTLSRRTAARCSCYLQLCCVLILFSETNSFVFFGAGEPPSATRAEIEERRATRANE